MIHHVIWIAADLRNAGEEAECDMGDEGPRGECDGTSFAMKTSGSQPST